MVEEDVSLCTICLEPLALERHEITTTQCRHQFHGECLRSWLEHGSRCPLCNMELTIQNNSYGEHSRTSLDFIMNEVYHLFTTAQCYFLDCVFFVCLLSIPVLIFYFVLYLGKAALWLLLLDRPPSLLVNATNASDASNATRTRKTIQWSPASVYFHDFFMGILALLMIGLASTICRACFCRRIA